MPKNHTFFFSFWICAHYCIESFYTILWKKKWGKNHILNWYIYKHIFAQEYLFLKSSSVKMALHNRNKPVLQSSPLFRVCVCGKPCRLVCVFSLVDWGRRHDLTGNAITQWVSARMSASITLTGSDHRSSTCRGQCELHGANKTQNERWGKGLPSLLE